MLWGNSVLCMDFHFTGPLFSYTMQSHCSFAYGQCENWGITLDEDWLSHVKNVQEIVRKRKTEQRPKNSWRSSDQFLR